VSLSGGSFSCAQLEATSHAWFDRSRWPPDFTGCLEADYYTESYNKRLRSATPRLRNRLRYAANHAGQVLAGMPLDAVLGRYERRPVENDWHRATVERCGSDGGGKTLIWHNDAGAAWRLTADLAHARLRTGPDNPYAASGPVDFEVRPATSADGDLLPSVAALVFGGDPYWRVGSSEGHAEL